MKNKILALDIGSKNTGIAISDRTQSIAFSYTTVKTLELKNQLELIIKTELAVQNISKAKAGISPNTIHNLDSLHLMLVIDKCNFDIVSAHDSYGSHASNVVDMQKCIREQFKYIIDEDPLNHILNETGNLVPMIKRGNLDSSEILQSEFAFA